MHVSVAFAQASEGRMENFRIGTVVLTCLSAIISGAESAPLIQGTTSVMDGDTIEIRGERIRLEAIDAPESSHLCPDADSKP